MGVFDFFSASSSFRLRVVAVLGRTLHKLIFLFLWLALRSIDIGRRAPFLLFFSPLLPPESSTEARAFGLHHTFSTSSKREREIAPHPTATTFLCCSLSFLLQHLPPTLLFFCVSRPCRRVFPSFLFSSTFDTTGCVGLLERCETTTPSEIIKKLLSCFVLRQKTCERRKRREL